MRVSGTGVHTVDNIAMTCPEWFRGHADPVADRKRFGRIGFLPKSQAMSCSRGQVEDLLQGSLFDPRRGSAANKMHCPI